MWRTLENTAIFNSENKNTVRIIPKMKPNDSEKVEAKKLKQSDKENTILVKMLSQNHKLLQKLAIISLAFTFSVSTGSCYHFNHTVPQKSTVVNTRDNLSISGYWSTLNPFTAISSNAHWTMFRKCVLQINHYTNTHKVIH